MPADPAASFVEPHLNVLIVLAHPEQQSYNTHLAQLAKRSLSERGHAVVVSDPYAMDFRTARGQQLAGRESVHQVRGQTRHEGFPCSTSRAQANSPGPVFFACSISAARSRLIGTSRPACTAGRAPTNASQRCRFLNSSTPTPDQS